MVQDMPGFRSLARNHDFSVLWIGQAVSELGTRMSTFVFPLLAYQLSHSTFLAALAEAAFLLGAALALLPAGVVADRVHRGRLMRLASGSGVLLYGSLVVAGVAGALTIAQLIVVGLLTGIGAGLFAPAETSAIRTVVPTEDLATALSQNQARQHLASLLGGPVGGALYGLVRWLPFAVDAISFAVSWLLLGRIRTDLAAPEQAGPRPSLRKDLAEGFGFIRERAFLRVLLVWAALANLVINAIFFVAILRLLQGGFSPAQIGLTDAVAGVAGIAGAVAAPALVTRFATGWLTIMVAWSFVPLLVPMMFWNNPAVVAAALGAGLFLNPAGNAGIGAYRIAITPERLQGRVTSTMQFVSMSAMPLAPLLGGGLLGRLGGPITIGVLAATTAAVALIVTLSSAVRSVPRPALWQTGVPESSAEVVAPATS